MIKIRCKAIRIESSQINFEVNKENLFRERKDHIKRKDYRTIWRKLFYMVRVYEEKK